MTRLSFQFWSLFIKPVCVNHHNRKVVPVVLPVVRAESWGRVPVCAHQDKNTTWQWLLLPFSCVGADESPLFIGNGTGKRWNELV